MYKAVIFDMDGVIIDSEIIFLECFKEVLQEQHSCLHKKDLTTMVGLNAKQGIRILADLCDNPGEIMELYDNKLRKLKLNYSSILNTGVRELLAFLKEKGLKVGLASSADAKDIFEVLEETKLGGYFDLLLSGERFRERKPNPEIYIHAARRLQVKTSECIVIEDSAYGIEAGKAAGAYVIAKEELRIPVEQKGADIILPDIHRIKDKILELTSC